MPSTMSGVLLTGHGGPEKLVWSDTIPVPRPGPGEALVRVRAAGVNNTDINTRIGWYAKSVTGATGEGGGAADDGGWAGAIAFPRIQGGDLCGEVVGVGPGVDRGLIGRRVTCPINQPMPAEGAPLRFLALGSEMDGAFAEYCRVDADQLFDVTPSPLSDVEIGAMPCAFGTAWNMIARAGVAGGDRVLVTGASGGVGLAAVQLACVKGARVTGISSGDKADAVRAAGAEQVIARNAVPEPGGYSVVIDIVGGEGFAARLEALVPGGRYAVSGAVAGPMVTADLRTIYLNDLTVFGCTHQPKAVFAGLVGLINAGRVRPFVSKTYPLRDIAAAQAEFLTKRLPGKLVLIP
ncbi:MAG: zinc-binding dehydrogenase [Paracoccaceae bacterium]